MDGGDERGDLQPLGHGVEPAEALARALPRGAVEDDAAERAVEPAHGGGGHQAVTGDVPGAGNFWQTHGW